MYLRKTSLFILTGLLSCPLAASAVTCIGVESRIISTGNASAGKEIAHLTAGFSAFDSMITTQMQTLLAAQKVVTSQDSHSASQENLMMVQSTKAAANAYVQGEIANQVRKAQDEFGTTGYHACSMEMGMGQFYNAYKKAFVNDPVTPLSSLVNNKPGSIASPSAWIKAVRSGENTSATALFGGDRDKAARYINVVMGPPDNWTKKSASRAEERLFNAHKLARDAQRGASLYVLSSIATETDRAGPQAALENVLDQYVGDGGERWSSSMAGSHPRGILLDATRLEAANVAAEAYALRKSMRSEFIIATYALSRINHLINQQERGGQ